MLFTGQLKGRFISGKNIEAEVRRYMRMLTLHSPAYTPNTVKPILTPEPQAGIPDFGKLKYGQRQKALKKWWNTERYRWKNGHNGMVGMEYSYVNYGKAPSTKGLLKMQYRRHDNEFFALCDAALHGENQWFPDYRNYNHSGTAGIYVLGRRRVGKSQKLGWLGLSLGTFNSGVSIGLQSKDEKTIRDFFNEKIKTPHSYLPTQLQAQKVNDTQMQIVFGKKVKTASGTHILNSRNLICKAPTPTSWEGGGYRLLVMDEFPKTPHAKEILQLSHPVLVDPIDGSTIVGLLVIAGVAGEFNEAEGYDAKDIWRNPKPYNLLRYFIPGWTGGYKGSPVDEYGNEDVEEAVRRILYHRKTFVDAEDEQGLNTIVQQYPLTPDEAFMSKGEDVLPGQRIYVQIDRIEHSPPPIYRGYYEWVKEGVKSRFVTDPSGPVHLVEYPPSNVGNPEAKKITDPHYISGYDTYDLKARHVKDVTNKNPRENLAKGNSLGSHIILKRETVNIDQRERDHINQQLAQLMARYKEQAFESYSAEALKLVLRLGNCPVSLYLDNPVDPDHFSEQVAMGCVAFNAPVLVEAKPATGINWFARHPELMARYLWYKPVLDTKVKLTRADYRTYGVTMNMGSGSGNNFADERLIALYHYYLNYSHHVFLPHLLYYAFDYNPSLPATKFDATDGEGLAHILGKDRRLKPPGVGVGRFGLINIDGTSMETQNGFGGHPLSGIRNDLGAHFDRYR